MDTSTFSTFGTAFRRRYAGTIELATTGVPIAVVLFIWLLVARVWWLDDLALLATGLLAASVVAVRQGRRFEAGVPFGNGTIPEHGRVLLATLPWLLLVPAVGTFLGAVPVLYGPFGTLENLIRDVAGWTAAGVVLVYLVAVLTNSRASPSSH